MGRSFPPNTDDGLLSFALNFSTQLTANYAALGVAQSVATTYSSKYNTYKTNLAAAQQPPTRGNASVLLKKESKADLMAYTRQVARTINNNMTVTDVQRQALGLTIRKRPSPVPAPSTRPTVTMVSVSVRTVNVKIYDGSSASKRGKAPGAIGAKVYTFIGSSYPSDPSLWNYEGDCTKEKHEINFASSVPAGAQVWICAAWYGRRNGDTGPTSVPVSTNIQGGGTSSVEMKIAA